MNYVKALSALALVCGLAACGGGGNALPDVVLPVADGQPEAYTTTYLSQHPEMLVQPEHMIVAAFENADVSARLYVPQQEAVSVGTADDATALAGIDIVDEDGHNWLRHIEGGPAVQALLVAGKYRVVFHAARPASGATPSMHLAYLKLADSPTQAQARLQRPSPPLLTSGSGTTYSLQQQTLGVGTIDSCIGCSFNGANLVGHDFSYQILAQSTFVGANIDNANFTGVACYQCQLTGLRVTNGTYVGFDLAHLEAATIQGYFSKVSFRGVSMQSAVVSSAEFNACDFGPATTGTPSDLSNADLSGATFVNWGDNGGIRQANLAGASFANMTPANVFAGYNFGGMDLSGVDFTGQDLSHADFSRANNVTLSATTDFWDATLTDGTTGIKLAGHDFGPAFTKFAGKSDGTTPGKDLRFVDFTGANLYQADLTSVRLDGATLVGANLAQTSLYKASLVGAQLGTSPDDATASAANLSGAYMPYADLSNADVRSVKFDGAHMFGGVKFRGARADSASMTKAILADADFTGASLSEAEFAYAILVNANFADADLLNAGLSYTYVQGANFVATQSVSGANLINAYVSTEASSWNFTEADGTIYSYGYGVTAMGDLALTGNGVATCPDGESGPCTGAKILPTASVPYPPPPPSCNEPGPDGCLPPHP
jgi:uncharacterized protein YjbI with pentapeptide repeats